MSIACLLVYGSLLHRSHFNSSIESVLASLLACKKILKSFDYNSIIFARNLTKPTNDNRSVERLEGSCERLKEVSLTTIVKA